MMATQPSLMLIFKEVAYMYAYKDCEKDVMIYREDSNNL